MKSTRGQDSSKPERSKTQQKHEEHKAHPLIRTLREAAPTATFNRALDRREQKKRLRREQAEQERIENEKKLRLQAFEAKQNSGPNLRVTQAELRESVRRCDRIDVRDRPPPAMQLGTEPLTCMLVEADYRNLKNRPVIRLHTLQDQSGAAILVHVQGFAPYMYVALPIEWNALNKIQLQREMTRMKMAINKILAKTGARRRPYMVVGEGGGTGEQKEEDEVDLLFGGDHDEAEEEPEKEPENEEEDAIFTAKKRKIQGQRRKQEAKPKQKQQDSDLGQPSIRSIRCVTDKRAFNKFQVDRMWLATKIEPHLSIRPLAELVAEYYGLENTSERFLELVVTVPGVVPLVKKILQNEGPLLFSWAAKPQLFECNVQFVTRYMVDTNEVGYGWLRIPAAQYRVRPHPLSGAAAEVDVEWQAVTSLGCEGEWAKVAPMRVLSMDIECIADGNRFPQAKQDPVGVVVLRLSTQFKASEKDKDKDKDRKQEVTSRVQESAPKQEERVQATESNPKSLVQEEKQTATKQGAKPRIQEDKSHVPIPDTAPPPSSVMERMDSSSLSSWFESSSHTTPTGWSSWLLGDHFPGDVAQLILDYSFSVQDLTPSRSIHPEPTDPKAACNQQNELDLDTSSVQDPTWFLFPANQEEWLHEYRMQLHSYEAQKTSYYIGSELAGRAVTRAQIQQVVDRAWQEFQDQANQDHPDPLCVALLAYASEQRKQTMCQVLCNIGIQKGHTLDGFDRVHQDLEVMEQRFDRMHQDLEVMEDHLEQKVDYPKKRHVESEEEDKEPLGKKRRVQFPIQEDWSIRSRGPPPDRITTRHEKRSHEDQDDLQPGPQEKKRKRNHVPIQIEPDATAQVQASIEKTHGLAHQEETKKQTMVVAMAAENPIQKKEETKAPPVHAEDSVYAFCVGTCTPIPGVTLLTYPVWPRLTTRIQDVFAWLAKQFSDPSDTHRVSEPLKKLWTFAKQTEENKVVVAVSDLSRGPTTQDAKTQPTTKAPTGAQLAWKRQAQILIRKLQERFSLTEHPELETFCQFVEDFVPGKSIRNFTLYKEALEDAERDMLRDMTRVILQLRPALLTGYNVVKFDLRYLLERAQTLGVPECQFWGCALDETRVREKKFQSAGTGAQIRIEVLSMGLVFFDMYNIMVADHKRDSYTLNSVSADFLNMQKDDVDHTAIHGLFHGTDETRNKLTRYCAKDTELPIQLMMKLQKLVRNIEMGRVSGLTTFELLMHGQQTKIFSLMLRDCKSQNLLIPFEPEGGRRPEGDEKYAGALVIDAQRGFYENPIITLDFASLYPSIMITYNLCFSTELHGYAEARDAAARFPNGWDDIWIIHLPRRARAQPIDPSEEARNTSGRTLEELSRCVFFVKAHIRKGRVPAILEGLIAKRKALKKLMDESKDPVEKATYDGRQNAVKILANSMYGFMGAHMCPNVNIAEAVTQIGTELISRCKAAAEEIVTIKNGFLHDLRVVYGDTDSIMCNPGSLVSTEEEEQIRTKIQVMVRVEQACRLPLVLVDWITDYLHPVAEDVLQTNVHKCILDTATFKGSDQDMETKIQECSQKLSIARAMTMGDMLSRELTALCKKLNGGQTKIEFEKVYFPYMLMNKKRYFGNKYEGKKPPARDCKGFELQRRGNTKYLRDTLARAIDLILQLKTQEAIAYVRSRAAQLLRGEVETYELIRTASISKAEYKNPPAHVRLAERIRQRDPLRAPQMGDRVQLLYVLAHKNAKEWDRIEEPLFAIERGIPLDYMRNFEKQFRMPMGRIFSWIFFPQEVIPVHDKKETDKAIRALAEKTAASLFGSIQSSIRPPVWISEASPLKRHFSAASKCLGCKAPLKSARNETYCCRDCLKDEQKHTEVLVEHTDKIQEAEKDYCDVWEACRRCIGDRFETEFKCSNNECPLFYKRHTTLKRVNELHRVAALF